MSPFIRQTKFGKSCIAAGIEVVQLSLAARDELEEDED